MQRWCLQGKLPQVDLIDNGTGQKRWCVECCQTLRLKNERQTGTRFVYRQQCTFAFVISEHEAIYHSVHLQESVDFRDQGKRKQDDRMKKDFRPTLLDFGDLRIYLARHFGFCYGVENAIEIAFRTIDQNPGKRIFLLSEMIHNPKVNADLVERGVRFLQDTSGKQLIPFEYLRSDDIVIIPAFGTTIAIEDNLRSIGISIEKYNTTCPSLKSLEPQRTDR